LNLNDVPDAMLNMILRWRNEKVEMENQAAKTEPFI